MSLKIPRFFRARPFQIQANTATFNVLIGKLMYRFVERCRQSESSPVSAMVRSAGHFQTTDEALLIPLSMEFQTFTPQYLIDL